MIMTYQESKTVELKRIVTEDIKKEIIAFVSNYGINFEDMQSLNQNLTFESTAKEFNLRNVEFGQPQMKTLKLIDKDGLYSNLALLLSDQCSHTIKVAVFQGTDQLIFRDRREFSGSLMKQMNEVYDFIDFRNQTRSTIEGLVRIDVRDYPEVAVREALLNLLVHRDYSFSASALISIYEDRIEFVSVGGLMPGIDLDDVMAGISICRNQTLANVFYRLHLIEAYGTGMGKIMKAYENEESKPSIETTRNTFKIILPNINAKHETKKPSIHHEYQLVDSVRETAADGGRAQVLDYIQKKGSITRTEAENILKTSSSTASRIIRGMVDEGILMPHGKARSTEYTLANN